MPTIKLRPENGPLTITQINCGEPATGSAKLAGEIDISPFYNLTSFRCNGHDIVSFAGYENKDKLVTLSVENNKITGSIENLNGLVNIDTLDFQNNRLSGPIPSVRGCSKLRLFRLFHDNTPGYVGQLSGKIDDFNVTGMFPFLRIVNYGNNRVSGAIPKISGMSSLLRFICYENLHTGSIPDLSGLPILETYYCYRNQLDGTIPESLSSCTDLVFFACYENKYTPLSLAKNSPGRGLTGPIPSLSNLLKLDTFNCYRNVLTENIPDLPVDSVSNSVVALKTFNCYDNLLDGEIPDLVADNVNFAKLETFNCDNNSLSGEMPEINRVVSGVKKLPALKYFACGSNLLTGSIKPLSGMTSLNYFKCSDNRLNGIIPSLSGLTALRTFICSGNNRLDDASSISGPIPNLQGLGITTFSCNDTRVSSYGGTVMPSSIDVFTAQNTNLPQEEIDKILKAVFVSGAGSKNGSKILNLGGRRPSDATLLIPSYDGPAPASLPGINFSLPKNTTDVIVNYANHGLVQGQYVTIIANSKTVSGSSFVMDDSIVTVTIPGHGFVDGSQIRIEAVVGTGFNSNFTGIHTISVIDSDSFTYTPGFQVSEQLIGTGFASVTDINFSEVFKGTFMVLEAGLTQDSFRYKVKSSFGTDLTGQGTAILRTTPIASESGYAYYQRLTYVWRTNDPWNVTINQPQALVV